MKSPEIRQRFLEFFAGREHSIITSASLLPENDPSSLFISAGMQPLLPYLLGKKHPQGRRIVDIQKCVRTTDIEEVGDGSHLTFFEMLGNWSLGDPSSLDGIGKDGYFKEEAIGWSYELLTDKEKGFGLDPRRLHITCFEGNNDAPRDEESARIWRSFGIPESRIYFFGAEDNWWSAGEDGPSGPDTEMFYDISADGLGEMTKAEFKKADDDGKVVEIWNDVFMEYKMEAGKVVGKLKQKNVDTGAGLERLAAVLQGKSNVYQTDLFLPIMGEIKEGSLDYDEASAKIIADHIRAAVFIASDGVKPSNKDAGYILRRLLRRATRHADKIKMAPRGLLSVAGIVINEYGDYYENLFEEGEEIKHIIADEEKKFRQTLERGMKIFKKIRGDVSAAEAFELYQSYGFPLELLVEMAKEKNNKVDTAGFEEELIRHQEISRSSAVGKFKGGLAGEGEKERKYHTATHLLNAALRRVLGGHIAQRGSNITAGRLRFDFSHPEKMSAEEIKRVEDLVNKKIAEALPVSYEEVSLKEAEKMGALGAFGEKYGERVKVYKIGPDKSGEYFSMEICGGPHVENTKEIGRFKIVKENSSSAGVRRIKAVIE